MAKKQFKKFTVTISYRIEVSEDYNPGPKDEKQNWQEICYLDPEIDSAKIRVEEA